MKRTIVLPLLLLSAACVTPALAAAPRAATYAAEASVGLGAPNQPDGVLPTAQPYARFVPVGPVTAGALPAGLLQGNPAPPHITNTYTVTTEADTGSSSLRSMIGAANANPGTDLIAFAIPGGGLHTIRPTTALPTITDPVVIDGTTQTGFAGTPLIEIDGSLTSNVNGLLITAGNSTVRGLIINRFHSTGGSGFGIILDVAGGNTIAGNWVGINSAGTAAAGNSGNGIAMFGNSGANIIGGLTPADANLVSGNGSTGIACASGNIGGNIIRGNWIGLNAAGTAAVGNGGNGIFTNASNCIIGGTQAGARNIVSANALPGVFIGLNASGCTILGNWIGTDAIGANDLGNAQNGIDIDRASNTTIGGNTAAARNVIAGNEFPNIYVLGPGTNTKVQGNYIGTDVTGTIALGDGNAIVFDSTPNNLLGGSNPGEGNLISGQTVNTAVVILNASATGNVVRGNLIGTNAAGTAALGNFKGILVNAAPGNVIGGPNPGDRNVISGNETYGVEFRGANNCRASGNYIGTDLTGAIDLGNKLHGIVMSASNDTIGGAAVAYGNAIAYNGRAGVYDSVGTGDLIRFNRVWENKALGIDLYPRGIVPNDTSDADTGPNNQQNFPILDSTAVINNHTVVYGTMLGAAGTTYALDFYASSTADTAHFGEGKDYIASTSIATDAAGRAPIAYDFGILVPDDLFLAATATDSLGNTSEFSPTLCMADHDADGIPDCNENAGWPVDVNHDGVYDLDLHALGADPNYKDIFVEVDAMSGYAPPIVALQEVKTAFANLPAAELQAAPNVQGIHLWPQVSDTEIAARDFGHDFLDSLQAVKDTFFGTALERAAADARWVLQAKRRFYRYCLFARTIGPNATLGINTTNSGFGEGYQGDGGDDFLVTFGDPIWQVGLQPEHYAGTFMHELGHTLGLRHGGADHVNNKPNYYSVMNYMWQMPMIWTKPGTWRLDYSRAKLPDLDESNLDETKGLGAPAGVWPPTAVPFTNPSRQIKYALLAPGAATDWTWDGVLQTGRQVDINLVGEPLATTNPGERLVGRDDWSSLVINFRSSPNFTPAHAAFRKSQFAVMDAVADPEMDFATFQRLNALPPPRPESVFVMDGTRDPNSFLVGSSGGLSLYAALKPGSLGTQVYLAVSGATAGHDVAVYVAKTPGALQAAPLGKAGRVAAWSAALDRLGTAGASDWLDGASAPFDQIATDSAGTFLEGVVQLDLLLGEQATSCAVALGSYGAGNGGALLAQIPAGDGDGDIEANEWATLSTSNVGVVPGSAAVPGTIALSSALPNPARGATRVRLSLPKAADVVATVRDVAGRTIATLARGRMAAGTHELMWDHAAPGGRRMPSGVYFVVVQAAGETRSTRVVVLE